MNRIINAVLKRAPNWLLDFIEWMLRRDSRLIRWVKQRAAAGLPVPDSVPADSGAEIRLFIGPFNYANQGWQWARSLEHADTRISARNLTVTFQNDLGFASDARVLAPVFAGSEQWKQQQRAAFTGYTHVLIESFTSTLGYGRGAGLEREARWHLAEGRRVALLCHGSDIRSALAHRKRNQHSPFALMDRATEREERRVVENKLVAERLGVPVFYSTPDLVHDVPGGVWLPLVVDPAGWERAAEAGVVPGERKVPVVLHAPTSRRMKGSAAVERAAEQLTDVVEYRPLFGVPYADMPNHIAQADIVVDQLLLGSYGAAACEAMAAGRVVIGNIDDEVREFVQKVSGLELPIVQADPDTLERVLRRVASDPAEIARAASAGPAFVRHVHTGSGSLPAMSSFLGLSAADRGERG